MATREFPELAITEAISSIDLQDDARIRREYDGRGMYGRPGFGVVVPSMRDALRLMVALGVICGAETDSEDEEDSLLPDLVNELAQAVHFDNMGYEVIVYFDGWQLANR